MSVYFGLLGPLRVVRDGREVAVTAAKERVVLAALLLEAGRSVSVEQLTDAVWGDAPIASFRQSLSVYVYRLRTLVGDDVIVSDNHGYRLDLTRCGVDLADFDRLVADADQAQSRGDLPAAAQQLRAALDLWRGEPLGNVGSDVLHRHTVAGLVERRLGVLDRCLELDITLGRARDAVVELKRLVEEHPLRERLWALLMRAQHTAGEQTEALAAYRDITTRLADQLGIDPGPELRDLHQAILTGTLDTPAPAPATTRAEPTTPPRQLPATPAGFVGRDDEVAQLMSWRPGRRSTVVISGPPGVGKSALAVTVGHRLVDRFPDGQLFVDLRGFSAEQALRAGDVLPRFLRALGTPGDQIPADEDEQTAAFRSATADRQLLVVLDNAATPDQVRPLLPSGPGCAVIVTSRNQLSSLIALDGAQTLPLGVLAPDDATAVLLTQNDTDRMASERDAATRIAELCGRLPLALRVASAYLALRPDEPVADYAAELDRGGRLLTLWAGDDHPVTVAFELSYAALDTDAQQLFRALGMIPGPDFTADAVTALTGQTDVRRRLDALVSASLVHSHGPGRYRMHDLVRDYARLRAADDDTATANEARQRLFDWYIRMVDAAMLPQPARFYRLPRPLPDDDLARRTDLAWVDDELANLTAAITHCAEHGPYHVVWHLTDALRLYAHNSGNETEFAAANAVALPLAEREGDLRVVAAMLLGVGFLRGDISRADEHLDALRQAAVLFAKTADRHGEATAWHRICVVSGISSRLDDSIAAGIRARDLFESLGDAEGVIATTRNLGLLRSECGQLTEAVADLETAVRDDSPTDPESRARAHTILGHALRRVGRLAEAADHLELGIEQLDQLQHRAGAGTCRCDLARCLCDAGDYDHARSIVAAARESAERDGDRENLLEARAVIAELDVRSVPPAQWDRGGVPTTAEMEPIAGHPLYFRWLDILGWGHVFLGDHDKAAEIATSTLDRARERSLRLAEDAALTLLTAAQVGLGKHEEAVETGTEALHRHRETGYRLREARTLCHLGDAHHATGDTPTAREHWQQAHDVYTAIGTAEVTEATRRLSESPDPDP